jgi:hydroxymethylpyrimidine pyrophosphatase-like HAD family hydrolase
MRYHALATDYDGTLARHGAVDETAVAALEQLRDAGRRAVLVTGRRLDDLMSVFDRLDLFERVVAENGAVLYDPAKRRERLLCEPPPPVFAERLRAAGAPVDTGRVIVATWTPHESEALAVLREMGLAHQIIFNKGAVMVLPPRVDKALGLQAALENMGLSPRNAAAVGDAENDLALLELCEFAAAVANALPSVKAEVDWVTEGDHGLGVCQVIRHMIADDLREFDRAGRRRHLTLGLREDGSEAPLSPYGHTILLAGGSGSGKSTFAAGFLERLAAQGYQYCCIDPEGDYSALPGAVVLGTPIQAPVMDEVTGVLDTAERSCVVNMVAVPLTERPGVFAKLFTDLLALRARSGRPQWIMIDETHHLWPAGRQAGRLLVPEDLDGVMLLVPHPDHVEPAVLRRVNLLIVLGDEAEVRFQEFARVAGCPAPPLPGPLRQGEAWVWRPGAETACRLRTLGPSVARRRHLRKYVQGELEPDRCFYFTGPAHALKLRAQNLVTFIQLAEGVDDATWDYHLRRGDYSRWFRGVIKDEELAVEVERVERDPALSPQASRERVARLIDQRYTLPA